MESSMSPELQKTFENTWAYKMNQQLKEMFVVKASKERLDDVKSLMACKPKPGASIYAFVLEMKGYFDRLESLNMVFDTELSINIILSGLPADYNQFVLSYQINGKETSIMELHSLLQTVEQGIKKSDVPYTSAAHVLTFGHNVESEIAPTSDPKEAVCFYCNTKGHWKRSCPKYLKDLKDGKVKKGVHSGMYMIELHNTTTSDSWVLDTGCGTHICAVLQGLKESRRLKHGELNLIMGNRKITPVTRIGKFELMLKSGVRINLNNCCYSSEMTRNIISFHALFKDGYQFSFDNENGDILVYSNGCFMFKASPCKGIYETVECISNDGNMILNVGSSNELDKSKLWHSRLGHVNKKRIAQLQKDEVLESFDFKSDDVCESCLLGKMTKSPFTGTCERGEGLLDLVHTDVCGPFRSATKDGKRYYVTFTDDFSRYGYVYLIKHKSDTFEVFKRYQNEVENQLGRKIKLTPPRTPQLNGVAERRNRTLLDMVRSMMCRATLPISFWGYALETAAHILNLVPTKKVSKTPFEMWKGKRPSLGHIKIWGCEVFVRREAQDKLEARSEKCLFIGYPEESFGYLFYKPKDNVVFVARRGVFLEREMISKEDSGSKIDLEEIQESADEEPIINTDTQQEVVTPVEPDDISLPIRRTSSRVSKPSQDPQFYYGFHIEEDKISDSTLTELNEPANYKEAMASPEAAKWKEAMKSEIQSMYDNQV
ncbi:putative RNA-directed DNA polymerase [Tanacetum coccineum]